MRAKISKARTVLSLAHSSEEATLFDFGLREARAGIDTSCLKDKKIEKCDSCDITGKWHYEEESEEEGVIYRTQFDVELTEDNLEFIRGSTTATANKDTLDAINAYRQQNCPEKKPVGPLLADVSFSSKTAFSSPSSCLLLHSSDCTVECTAEFNIYLNGDDLCSAPPVINETSCDAGTDGGNGDGKVSLSEDCNEMTYHDILDSDGSSDMVFKRVDEPAGDYILVAVGVVLVIIVIIVAVVVWKFKGKKEEEHIGDDGLYEMGRDFDDDF